MTGYLSEESSWRGRFWLPGQSDEDQRGVLTYSPQKGVLLTLIGGFDDAVWLPTGNGSTSVLSQRSRSWPIIHGVVGQKPVTLLDCVATTSKSYMVGAEISEQEIRASDALLGVLLDDADGPVFCGVTVELENLTAWDLRPDVGFEIEYNDDNRGAKRWRITAEPVDPHTGAVGDLAVQLGRWYRLPSHDVLRGRLEATTFAVSRLTVRASQPKSLGEWTQIAHVFQDLVTLAIDAPCAMLKQALLPSEDLQADQQSAARSEIAVYANHIVKGDPDAPGVEAHEALFTLGTDGVDFETVVNRWFAVYDQFRASCDMTLSLVYAKGGYLQNQLITAVAAAEAMHEALQADPPMPDDEFKALKRELMRHVPENRRQWLSDKLGQNKHTLRQRLLHLAGLPSESLMTQLLPNPGAWADAAKKSRDLIAHGGKSNIDIQLMYAITEVTVAVIIVNLLHHLGVPDDRLMRNLATRGRLERAARLAREQWP